jgi:hypothetical protein
MRHTGRMGIGRDGKRLAPCVVLILALMALSGCGGSIALTLAGVAGDAVSRAATGKGMIDAAVSGVAARDCAVYRMLNGENMCRNAAPAPKPVPVVAMAAAAPDAMPFADVTFEGKDGRSVTWAPVEGGWVPLDESANAEDGAPAEAAGAAPAAGRARMPSADAVIFAAAGSDERIDPER